MLVKIKRIWHRLTIFANINLAKIGFFAAFCNSLLLASTSFPLLGQKSACSEMETLTYKIQHHLCVHFTLYIQSNKFAEDDVREVILGTGSKVPPSWTFQSIVCVGCCWEVMHSWWQPRCDICRKHLSKDDVWGVIFEV